VKPEGKRPLRMPRHRRKNKAVVDFQEVRRESMDWIDLA